MDVYSGKASFKGIAIGRIVEMKRDSMEVHRIPDCDPEVQAARYFEAKVKAGEELRLLSLQCAGEIGEADAELFKVYAMLLDSFDDSVLTILREQNVNAEYAVARTGDKFVAMFAAMEDNPYMLSRQMDLRDVTDRLLRKFDGEEHEREDYHEEVILIADDLAPSEAVQLDKSRVRAFVTREGTTNSHTAILARTMVLPALCQTPVPEEAAGKLGIVDGFAGCLYVDPDEETLAAYRRRAREAAERLKSLEVLKGKPSVTRSGQRIRLYANINDPGDLESVYENDAEGVGLFRSEFLYMKRDDFPSEEEQFEAYRAVAEGMEGREVVIRTLDIGADKQTDYFGQEQEENPALGCRAIRICLIREEIFKTQLRALYRASAYGNIRIIFPMIISVWEVDRIWQICDEVKRELASEGVPFNDVPLGIMIETPAAVLIAEELARKVDFFSIGTNDLTQYTLALDVRNQALAPFFNPHHPAVLSQIRMTVEAGHRHKLRVGICGELGADPAMTEAFVRMGIDELSVSPAAILPLRKAIRRIG